MQNLDSDFSQILKFDPANVGKRVIVGMSGGVDSSVCALILKHQGFDVTGMFMKNWEEDDENGVCKASLEYDDVIKVCEKLEIPYYSVDFVKEYRENVFAHFLREYKMGHTPNPDILCNREIKFKVFFEKARELGADFLATGHYCQNQFIDGTQRLVKGVDTNKDQTYFLYAIQGKVLDHVLFPVGNLPKPVVRALAREYGLSTSDKKDSTGICFIGERNFRNFLSQYVTSSKGNFETIDGTVVGEHTGSVFYTIGQRKGLGLGGQGEPWFVVGKDHQRNVVIVERGEFHTALYSEELTACEISWIAGEFSFSLPFKCKAKIRYRQPEQDCVIESIENGRMKVTFPKAQRAATVRQSIVFYDGNVCLGGAMIEAIGPSLYAQGKYLPEELKCHSTNTLDH